jgi:hypothetical protein
MGYFQRIEPVDYSTFDAEKTDYTSAELDAYAEALLREDIKANGNVQHILFKEHLAARARREVVTESGVADKTLTNLLPKGQRPGVTSGDGQMMYNRTHPRGRKVNSKEHRLRNRAAFYRN